MSFDQMNDNEAHRIRRALDLLDLHYKQFSEVVTVATETGHPVATDTRGWSQILVSLLLGIRGPKRKKGPDLVDGSDVKGALIWEAIDTPRFNGVLKANTKAEFSGKIESLDSMPHLFFVLWDKVLPDNVVARCRIWCVRPKIDPLFRGMAQRWFDAMDGVPNANCQLHPPRNAASDTNIIHNGWGMFEYPLLLCAERPAGEAARYAVTAHHPEVLENGLCEPPTTREIGQLTSAIAEELKDEIGELKIRGRPPRK